MKPFVLFLLLSLMSALPNQAQTPKVSYQSFEHYNDRVAEFETMRPVDSTDIVMLGNSLTEFAGDWNKLLAARRVRNRGIAGDDAMGIFHRLVQILPGNPKAIFLMVGINDLSHDLSAAQVFELCRKVIDKIRAESPQTKLYVQSLLPINESFGRWKTLEGKTDEVAKLTRMIRRYCEANHITYINLFRYFNRHGTNEMRPELTSDGLHLSPLGYKIWAFHLKKYLRELAK